MKKLSNLEINSKKIINKEELVILRGGYNGNNCCECYNDSGTQFVSAQNTYDCSNICFAHGFRSSYWVC